MPISIKGPDGTINQFPDGMADADIEKVMAEHYPQPSVMDRVAASPVGRLAHDFVGGMVGGATRGPMDLARSITDMLPGNGATMAGTPLPQQAPHNPGDPLGVDASYGGALARNRNTPGYAKERALADQAMAGHGGFQDQIFAPFLPAVAGTAGLLGGLDSSNAMADSQASAQAGYQSQHPILSFGANLAGGLLTGRPDVPMALPTLPPVSAMAGQPIEAAALRLQRMGADPAKLRAAQTAAGNKPITTAEAIGKPAEIDLGALARREGQTGDALGATLQTRNEAMPGRVLGDYAQASGINPLAARGDIEGFIEANKKAASPLYEGYYKANPNVSSPRLDRILETPAGKKALASARVNMQNDMSLMGTPDADLMAQAVEGGTEVPGGRVASGMKARVYDYVKKSLNAQAKASYKEGNSHEGDIISDLARSLTAELDKADVTAAAGPNSVKPEGGLYAQARAKAGEYLSAKKQFEAGADNILDNNLPAKDFAGAYAKLGPADQQAYLGGVANKLFNLQQTGKLKADVFKNPIIRNKLATIMGEKKASQFLANMATEKQMAEFARTQAPRAGSGTAGWQQAMADQDGNSSLALDAVDMAINAGRHGVVSSVLGKIGEKGRDAAAAYLTRGMGIPVRDELGRLYMQPPGETASFLEGLPRIVPKAALQRPALPNKTPLPLGLLPLLAQPSPVGVSR